MMRRRIYTRRPGEILISLDAVWCAHIAGLVLEEMAYRGFSFCEEETPIERDAQIPLLVYRGESFLPCGSYEGTRTWLRRVPFLVPHRFFVRGKRHVALVGREPRFDLLEMLEQRGFGIVESYEAETTDSDRTFLMFGRERAHTPEELQRLLDREEIV